MKQGRIIELQRVSLRMGERTILRDIDWNVRQGEHWSLLGRNGSGKTSLLRVIAGYVWPQEGTIRVMGETYGRADLPALRRRIGWVTSFLKRQIRGHFTALEVVLSGLDASIGTYRDFSAGELRRAGKILRQLGCARLADQPFETLSQGERQRVLLGRGIVHEPDLLILDEPCSGLDPLAVREFLGDLALFAARKDAPTIIYVTHHLEELPPFVEKSLLLSQGQVLAAGSLKSTLTRANLTATFGAPCRMVQTRNKKHLVWD